MDARNTKKPRMVDPVLEALDRAKEDKVPFIRLLAADDSFRFDEKLVRVEEEEVHIGRSGYASLNNLLFNCLQLSAHHATLMYKRGSFTLSDNKSTNGTSVNGQKIGSVPVEIYIVYLCHQIYHKNDKMFALVGH